MVHRWPRPEHAVTVPSEMGAVQLCSPFEVADSILEVSQPARVGVGVRYGHGVQLSAPTNECGVGNVVLSDEKCRLGAFLAHESVARPAPNFIDDHGEAISVAAMHITHLWVVATEQLTGLGEAGPNRKIMIGQTLEFISQVGSLHSQNLVLRAQQFRRIAVLWAPRNETAQGAMSVTGSITGWSSPWVTITASLAVIQRTLLVP